MKKKLKKFIPPTTQRVRLHTNSAVNNIIRNQTIESIDSHFSSNENQITDRINELNHEWDMERIIEVNAASLVIISTILGLKCSPKWFLVTTGVGAFLLQHALQGWCPPVPLARQMGVRTAEEINHEKIALKILRGDFNNCNAAGILSAVEKQ